GHMRMRLCMIQLTAQDSFRPLRHPLGEQPFHRCTLFPDTPWPQAGGGEMVRRLHACLDELGPTVVCINGWSFGGSVAALRWCIARRVPAVLMSESTTSDERRRWWIEA